MLRTPDGYGKVELARYRSPSYEGDDWQRTTVLPLTTTGRDSGAKRTTASMGL